MVEKTTLPGIPECDRPYEKLELLGASSLSDSELLAVILRSGTKEINVIDLARKLLFKFNGRLKNVCCAGLGELSSVHGIGRVKAIQLKAAGELALRIERDMRSQLLRGGNSDDIADFIIEQLWGEPREVFIVVMLDKRLHITGSSVVSRGTIDCTLVHPRDVFAPAVKELAYAVVVAHNHPSGSTEPSGEDIALTKRLRAAGTVLGIELLDHIIVGRKEFSSFKAMGLMDDMQPAKLCRAVEDPE